jgi:UDP-N-acetylmuramate-alanine ligase
MRDPFIGEQLPISNLEVDEDGYTFTFQVTSSQDAKPKKLTKEDSLAGRKPKPVSGKEIFYFSYDSRTQELTHLVDKQKETKQLGWASVSPDGQTVVYAKDMNIGDGGASYTLCIKNNEPIEVRLSVGGEHNVLDSLAAFGVIYGFGLDLKAAADCVGDFISPKRRYELVFKKDDVTVIDDFAHHPTELNATLKMARAGKYDTVIAVFQPHTYTRTAALLDEFAKSLSLADHAIVLPIYAAREKDIYNVSSADLAALVPGAETAKGFEDAAEKAKAKIRGKTVILTVGAGDVYKVWEYLK